MARILRAALTLSVVAVVGAALFAGGFVVGHVTGTSAAAAPQLAAGGTVEPPGAGTPAELKTTFAPFWEAWSIVHQEYVDQPLDDTQLMQGAISGMVKALGDPHSSYMTPAEYKIFNTDLSGGLEGIGAQVEPAGDYLRIVSPLPGSPAEAAGLLPGDIILKVDQTDIGGMGEMEAIGLVRGPAGTKVHLTIQRKDHKAPLEFDIVRAKITIPSVEGKLLPGGVAYVKINDFGDKTSDELKGVLKSLLAQKPVGLVLDLRGNPGGYLDTAIEVASQFIPDGLVMRERFGDGHEKTYTAISGGLATRIPLVVLINKGSASASEIVAGAIQDRKRGTIVGETSYGKGSVQDLRPLAGDGGVVRVTIARWLTPNGRSIHKLGITPDVAVELTEDDRAAGRDPQLDQAVSLLTSRGVRAPDNLTVAHPASLP